MDKLFLKLNNFKTLKTTNTQCLQITSCVFAHFLESGQSQKILFHSYDLFILTEYILDVEPDTLKITSWLLLCIFSSSHLQLPT